MSGNILPSSQVKIDSILGAVDQSYPEPDAPLGVIARAGHYQVSNRGQGELLVVGVQGKRIGFDDLPPMNLAFVIDKSGSMADSGKMEWVKQSFDIFIDKVRAKDFVSLVVFDGEATVLFPSGRASAGSWGPSVPGATPTCARG